MKGKDSAPRAHDLWFQNFRHLWYSGEDYPNQHKVMSWKPIRVNVCWIVIVFCDCMLQFFLAKFDHKKGKAAILIW